MRLFLAAWPPAEAAAALHDWSRSLQGKATARENIHLTLAFLGEADRDKASAAAKRVRGERHALPIEAARYVKRNEMVWVGPRQAPPALVALVERLRLELYRDEFFLERRPFAAHVTLLRKAPAPERFPPLPKVDWPIDEFLLVRSRTSPRGPAYETLDRYALG